MADKVVETQELTPPMQPGVDHPQHAASMRQAVAENAGVNVLEVTPQNEIAGNIVDEARTDFLEKVAGVEQPVTTTSPDDLHKEGKSNLREIFNAYNPIGDSDNKDITERTTPNQVPNKIVSARNAQKEAA